MEDEKFLYIKDIREKKSTGRSARNRRTHAGKGGRVRFPSDYLSTKEKKAMNGKVESYRINDPMAWAEFKALPDDIKVMYIKALRNRFHAPDTKIAEMLGIHKAQLSKENKRLGLSAGANTGKTTMKQFDREGWERWAGSSETAPGPASDFADEVAPALAVEAVEAQCEADSALPVPAAIRPTSGTLCFEGRPAEVFDALVKIIGDAKVSLTVSWEYFKTVGIGVTNDE